MPAKRIKIINEDMVSSTLNTHEFCTLLYYSTFKSLYLCCNVQYTYIWYTVCAKGTELQWHGTFEQAVKHYNEL